MEYSRKLSIRKYNTRVCGHSHPYYQILIPILGKIDLHVSDSWVSISYGKAAIIHKNSFHYFRANEGFRFIVMDLDTIPCNFKNKKIFNLNQSILKYVSFIDEKLIDVRSKSLESSMCNLLYELLEELDFKEELDPRIYKVINAINESISYQYSLNELSAIAHLSVSQLKVVFKKNIGISIREYACEERMKKAMSLLVNTDTPLNLISAQCGYQNPSAFSKRFFKFYGNAPKWYRNKQAE